MLKIIKGTPRDALIISKLGRLTFSESFGHLFRDQNDLLEYLEYTFSREKINSSLQKESNLYWLAYWDKKPVGYAKLKLNSSPEFIVSEPVCQLQKIYVLKEYTSMKIGHNLQNEILEEATQLGFKTIWLSVWTGNDRAIQFYRKNQFRKIGDHGFSIGKENFDFQAMALKLNEDEISRN